MQDSLLGLAGRASGAFAGTRRETPGSHEGAHTPAARSGVRVTKLPAAFGVPQRLTRNTVRGLVLLLAVAVIAAAVAVVARRRRYSRFLDTARLSIMDREVRLACHFVEKHFADPGLDGAAVARGLTTGESFLQALFERELGMTVGEFITQVRVNSAKEILRARPEVSSEELCRQVGFESPDALARAFQTVTGASLDQYASSHARESGE